MQDNLRALQNRTATGVVADGDQLTFSEFMARWLESTRASIRKSTFTQYEILSRRHIVPKLSGLRMSKLQPIHIQALYSELEREGMTPRTLQLVHGVLHRAMSQATKWAVVPTNPVAVIDKPRAPRKPMLVWSQDEARAFLNAAAGDRLEALYVLALTTGMRQGELLGLSWSDVDLKRGTLHIQRQLVEVADKLELDELKTRSAKRKVQLPAVAVTALKKHRS